MISSYERFVEDMLVAVAERQSGVIVSEVSLSDLYIARGVSDPPTFLDLVGPDLQKRGFGTVTNRDGNRFVINGAGLSEVEQIRDSRRKKTIKDFAKSFSRSDCIAIAALLVSALALFRS